MQSFGYWNVTRKRLTDKDVLCLVEIIAYQNMITRIMELLNTIEVDQSSEPMEH